MTEEVAIIGVGYTAASPVTPEVSYREMIYEAAVKAYQDAHVKPKDIKSFVCLSEDFHEGTSIFDEYVPDQLGAVLKPVHTVTGDGIHGLIEATMHIQTGLMDVVAVEAHSKASNILTPFHIMAFATDPVYNQPLKMHPYYIAGLEMNRFLLETGNTREHCAMVVQKNRQNALDNPVAAYGAQVAPDDVLQSRPLFAPLSKLDTSLHADGAVVMVLASAKRARELSDHPIWVKGIGWCSDSPSLENRDWAQAVYARLAGDAAYRMAGIRNPREEIDLAEIDDTFSYKELQHMEALRLCREGEAGLLLEEGTADLDGDLPINPSGGTLGTGFLYEASGLYRVLELVLQLRGEAGKRQLAHVNTGLAFSWRGIPTTSGAAIVVSNN
ncbi:MAG: acetyl-CoA acetyltransferase [Armatimonadetes bacterium]|nr:acetyl-CoA acetyltransferase [Armatimonadota bacterium]